ncbi:MAG: 30S ribosomal protein S6 [Clostridiaceae bacterium]|nr:30S ribosomal protein S6 [Clostridiaceae bacterium]
MTKVINKYETLFVINPNLGEEEIAGLVEKFKSLIESAGQLESVEEWGKRRLAYPIKNLNEGYYVLINFSAEPSFPQELERNFKITDGIIRAIVVKIGE